MSGSAQVEMSALRDEESRGYSRTSGVDGSPLPGICERNRPYLSQESRQGFGSDGKGHPGVGAWLDDRTSSEADWVRRRGLSIEEGFDALLRVKTSWSWARAIATRMKSDCF